MREGRRLLFLYEAAGATQEPSDALAFWPECVRRKHHRAGCPASDAPPE